VRCNLGIVFLPNIVLYWRNLKKQIKPVVSWTHRC
jgi:hypothetical protein